MRLQPVKKTGFQTAIAVLIIQKPGEDTGNKKKARLNKRKGLMQLLSHDIDELKLTYRDHLASFDNDSLTANKVPKVVGTCDAYVYDGCRVYARCSSANLMDFQAHLPSLFNDLSLANFQYDKSGEFRKKQLTSHYQGAFEYPPSVPLPCSFIQCPRQRTEQCIKVLCGNVGILAVTSITLKVGQ